MIALFSTTIHTKPVEYKIETLTSPDAPLYLSLNGYQSISDPDLLYFSSAYKLFEFNQRSGKLSILLGCADRVFLQCSGSSYFQQSPFASLPANLSDIYWQTFYLDERENTFYMASYFQIYKFKDGLITLLSDKDYNRNSNAKDGKLLKEAIFRQVTSITMDNEKNLYICDGTTIFKVGQDGILRQLTAKEGNTFQKHDGYANNTKLVNIEFITHRNGFLYGYDVFSIFKINLETSWLTIISGKSLINNDTGYAVDYLVQAKGLSFLPDDSILTLGGEYFRMINQTTGKLYTLFKSENIPISGQMVIGNDLLINNNKILKFDWMTGKVFPIFNELGSVSDGMLVEYRRFKSISAIAFNQTSGELFVADSTSENTIQKIDTLGRVIHIPLSFSNISCWNSSIEAGIDISYNPVALQVKDSNLFLANTGIHSSIEKIDFSKEGSNCFYAGSISSNRLLPISEPLSTILNSPNGIHCSKTFTEIYIADTENHRILKYINTKTVEVIAGNSVQGFSGDGGLAVNSQLDRPHSVYYEGSTRILYIADSGNHRIRYVQMDTGIISTLIGNGIPGFNGDELDPLETTLNFPKYVLNSPSLGLLISDSNNHRVRCFNNSVIKTILGTGNSGFKIVVNNPKSSEISSPFGLFLDSSNLYIADSFNHRILLLSIYLEGVPNFVSIIAGTNSPGYNGDGMNPIQAKLFLPSSVHLSSRGIIIGDYMNNRIRLIFNGIISTLEVSNQPAKIQLPTGVCSLKDDILVSSDNEILQISSYDIKTKVGGLGDGLHVLNANVNPSKIIFYPDNRMLISESNSNRIRLVDSYGKISTIAGNGKFGYGGDSRMAVDATLASPNGISFSPDFNTLYFADSSNNRIRKLVSNFIHLLAGTGDFGDISISTDPLKSQFKNPRLLTTLTNGDIVIGDTLNSQIRIISYKERTIRTIAYSIPATDMISTFNNTIYISTNEQILKVIPICENGFQLVRNNTECVPICHGRFESDACSRRGECISPDNCKCWDGLFTGKYCEIPICFGVAATDLSVCSNANGTCGLNNKCQCRDGFTGDNCENPICFSQGIGDACGGTLRGTCINKDKCLCYEHFTGERCELRMCSGKGENDAQVCNGHGKCLENGRCECNTLYSGLDCSDISQIYGLSIAGAIIVLILIVSALVSGILGLVVYRNNKKDRKILETDLFLDERLLASSEEHELSLSNSSTHTALATEDPSSFVIPLHKIGMDKPIKRLGSGGMGSVFMTKFNGMTVAVKVFDLNNLNISEEDFKNEAIILSKLRHPNIINFYGISTSPTKRYIVMECLDQSLENLITKMEKQQTSYLLDQKLRMMLNIANGIEYLHTLKPRRIIHRDLKTANILLDSNGNCKVCDFGLSKSISQATVSALTNQLGTHYYMSPELFDIKPIDPSYATSVDIYSFSIIMWQILFEIKDPYLSKSPEILKKLGMTSTDPHEQITSYQLTKMICEKNHRPVIPFTSINSCREWCSEYMPPSKQDESLPIFTLSQLIQQCWQTDPKLRPNIEQVIQQLESILSSLQ